ncbi:SMODS domain-containing nucleotidyltransferase [Inquilinus sp. OTU3971]|uniref:SMODS domain-containing nucleotidyltransferase n=1 Tax=Inquilinus sp. OTU3971 TaxID=3043855 RepID=UPI00313E14B0
MKLTDHFNTFMSDIVNLNATRVTLLEDSVETLKGVVRASDWTPKVKFFISQGSWAHKTIIKPVEDRAFDADLLVFVEPVNGWTAKDYLSTLRAVFSNHPTYKDKVRRYSHCVTIEYVGDRKIDIAPCIVDRGGVTRLEVCNFNTDAFELSEPKRYTEWLIERNGWTGNNGLRKVTRLLKYLRDIKGTFSCPSILFTTLLGNRITWADSLNSNDFADLPTALKTIVGRLDDWLQSNPYRPIVANPVLSSEVLSDLWNDDRYTNFREKIHTYRTWIDDAYAESDRDESIGKWRRVFGDDFARSVVIEKAPTDRLCPFVRPKHRPPLFNAHSDDRRIARKQRSSSVGRHGKLPS